MKLTLTTFCVSLLLSISLFAQVPEHIRINAKGMGQAGSLTVKATGRAVFSSSNLKRVGGVLFQGQILNEDIFKNLKDIEVKRVANVANIDFIFTNNNRATYQMPYWMLHPALEYAISEDNAVVSLFGSPTDADIRKMSSLYRENEEFLNSFYNILDLVKDCSEGKKSDSVCSQLLQLSKDEFGAAANQVELIEEHVSKELREFSEYFFFVDIHPALKSTALGLRLLQADSLLMDTSYAEVIKVEGKSTIFPSEVPVVRNQTDSLNLKIYLVKQACQSKGAISISAWILTDVDTEYEVSIRNNKIVISGLPYYYMWGNDANEQPTEIEACTQAMKDLNGELALKAPLVWASAVNTARFNSLVATLASNHPALVQKLINSVRKSSSSFDYKSSTPRVWPRQGYEDI